MANKTTISAGRGRGAGEVCLRNVCYLPGKSLQLRQGSDLEATSIEINGYKSPTSRIEVVQELFLKSEQIFGGVA